MVNYKLIKLFSEYIKKLNSNFKDIKFVGNSPVSLFTKRKERECPKEWME